jgi:hypothetical protein
MLSACQEAEMSARWRRSLLLGASALSLVALSLGGISASAAATSPPLNLVLTGPHSGVTTFTLPSTDGFRDSAKFTITAARKVDVDIALNAEGTLVKTIHAGTLSKAKHGYSKTVTITDSGLADSGYDFDAFVHGTKNTNVADKAPSLPAQVSDGKITTFDITQPTVYPDVKGSLSTLTSVFTATDDRGIAIPLHDAHLTLACPSTVSSTGTRTAKGESSKNYALSLKLQIPLYEAPAPFGQAGCSSGSNLIASAEGPADTGPQFKDGTATLLLAQISSLSVGTEFSVVYPKKDGYLDTVRFTVAPSPGASKVLPASGYVDVVAPGTSKVVKKFTITTLPQTFNWNGRVGSAIVPGTYQIEAHAKEADNPGLVAAPSVPMTVLTDELHKHTASLGWQKATDLVGGFGHSGTPIAGQPTPYCEVDSHESLECHWITDRRERDCGERLRLRHHGLHQPAPGRPRSQ